MEKDFAEVAILGNWDYEQLREVFVNLIGNAIDAQHFSRRIAAIGKFDRYRLAGHAKMVGTRGNVTIGAHNHFFAGCVIGEAPQDLKYKDEPTGLLIGDHNVFREHVTVHRSKATRLRLVRSRASLR